MKLSPTRCNAHHANLALWLWIFQRKIVDLIAQMQITILILRLGNAKLAHQERSLTKPISNVMHALNIVQPAIVIQPLKILNAQDVAVDTF